VVRSSFFHVEVPLGVELDVPALLGLLGGEASREGSVTFFAADLTYDEVRVSYAAIWQSIGGKRTKGVKLEDVEFWRLVEYELGGPAQ
jgi:hypothetical protein